MILSYQRLQCYSVTRGVLCTQFKHAREFRALLKLDLRRLNYDRPGYQQPLRLCVPKRTLLDYLS